MQQYDYSGQLRGGSAIAGTLEASSIVDARTRLDEMGVAVTTVAEAAHAPLRRSLSADDLQFFNEQLASLAGKDMALEPGLRMMARDVGSRRLRRICRNLAADIGRGMSLPDAITRHGKAFPPLYAEVVQAGIESGRLGATLYNLNTHIRLMAQTRRAIWEVAGYPLVVLVVGFSILTLFFAWLVPQMEEMFEDFGMQLPMLTNVVVQTAHAWPVVLSVAGICIIALFALLALLRTTARGRSIREKCLLQLPGIAGVHRDALIALFARSAALSSAGGLPLPRILRLAAASTGSPMLHREAERCAAAVESGGRLTQTTLQTRLIPALFGYLVDTTGPRGLLTSALHDLARSYDDQAQQRLALLRVFLYPIFILFIATILVVIVLSMFLPLVSLINELTGS